MNFTPEQHHAIFLDGNLVVTAGAGSGKTRVLVERYLRLLVEQGQAAPAGTFPFPSGWASSILAITFTDKAAREMRDRVRTTVEQRARAAPPAERPFWEELRAAVEAARIGTIHSFCATLLRSQPAETGLDPHFAVLDEADSSFLLAESIDSALSEAVSTPTTVFEEFSPHELQALLLTLVKGGSTVRAAFEALPDTPDPLLDEWRTRLEALRSAVVEEVCSGAAWQHALATLHQLAADAPSGDPIGNQVARLVASFCPSQPPETLPFSLLDTINLQGGSKKAWPGGADDLKAAREALRTLRETYRAHQSLLDAIPGSDLEQRAARVTLDLAKLYAMVLEHYARRKGAREALDFDDLVRRTRELLEASPSVRSRWQAELSAVLVDEFQDTDDEQRAIIYALTGLANPSPPHATTPPPLSPPPSPPPLFVVGDGKQSIYRFRGADVSVFRAVEADIQTGQGQAVRMNTSFRTHPLLLAWVNRVMGTILARERPLQPYETPFEPLLTYREPPDYQRCVELHLAASLPAASLDDSAAQADEPAAPLEEPSTIEARALATRIKALVGGSGSDLVYDHARKTWRPPHYGDIALLLRTSTVFERYEQALRDEGIPYLTSAGHGYYGRKEVQDLIHLLSVLSDPMDDLALVGVLRSPLFALDDATIVRLRFANPRSLWDALMSAPSPPAPDPRRDFARDTLRELHAIRGQQTVVELLRRALAMTGYLATISGLHEGERRRANVEKLLHVARRMGSTGLGSFTGYLDRLLQTEPREGQAPLEAEGSVRLMTVHASKGLEFPVVVLPDLGRNPPNQRHFCIARRACGVALRLRSETGEWSSPAAYQAAWWEEQRMERAERERLLYVALTRARDYLILSGPVARKSGENWLSYLLQALGVPWEEGGPPPGSHGAMEVWWHTE
jgi:ATP-dependent helicase/nuclease subunit A